MLVKIHDAYRKIVAICDEDLIGKKFEDDLKQIDLTGKFFLGEKQNFSEVVSLIKDFKKEDAMFNLVGKESCQAGISAKLINDSSIIFVEKIPLAIVLA